METEAKLVALLFYSAEPISIRHIIRTLSIDKAELAELKKNTNIKLGAIGLVILGDANSMQLVIESKYSLLIENFYETSPEPLSQPALEVLSIIAHKQPIGKMNIDEIRGISSDQSIRNLINKGLIKKVTEDSATKYITTLEFLKVAGINSLHELGKLDGSDGTSK